MRDSPFMVSQGLRPTESTPLSMTRQKFVQDCVRKLIHLSSGLSSMGAGYVHSLGCESGLRGQRR
jgi:hypothetical protein